MIEEWKSIEGFGGYEISSFGRVRSVNRIVIFRDGRTNKRKGKILKIHINRKRWDYRYVLLSKDAKEVSKYVHRLVALHFIPNPALKPEVNHEDGDKGNNRFTNLSWVTPKENGSHAARTGLVFKKLSEWQVAEIRREMAKNIRGTRARLARKFRVREGTISFVCREHWGWL